VIAYVIASAIAYYTGKAELGVGPINGIIIAAVLYAVLFKVLPQQIRSFSR
jgi:cytosine permease